MKSCLIMGHAGHELRILKFIQLLKPIVFILTDGSGGTGKSRIDRTKKILSDLGCKSITCFFSDKEIYDIILQNKYERFIDVKNEILQQLVSNKIGFVLGDACEGFNPTHDMCRYMINSIAKDFKIKNYDFLLDNYPLFESSNYPNIIISLSKEDKQQRDDIIKDYPEIAYEIEQAKKAKKIYGENIFDFECLREVQYYGYKNWKVEKPYYEIYAEKKLKEGKYKEAITFNHVTSIADKLNS